MQNPSQTRLLQKNGEKNLGYYGVNRGPLYSLANWDLESAEKIKVEALQGLQGAFRAAAEENHLRFSRSLLRCSSRGMLLLVQVIVMVTIDKCWQKASPVQSLSKGPPITSETRLACSTAILWSAAATEIWQRTERQLMRGPHWLVTGHVIARLTSQQTEPSAFCLESAVKRLHLFRFNQAWALWPTAEECFHLVDRGNLKKLLTRSAAVSTAS